MPLPARRQITGWAIGTIYDPAIGAQQWSERASIPLLRELVRRHSELPTYGMNHFQGTKAQIRSYWREYRNYIIQALSYYDAAIAVPNRSACLLLYYALLNFAKAELLTSAPSQIIGQRIGHGLSYNPTKARKMSGDWLTISDGVFPLLYQKRTGHHLQQRQELPIVRLLRNIPEVASQLHDLALTDCAAISLFHAIMTNGKASWPSLLTFTEITPKSVTGRLFHKVFQRVAPSTLTWRDEFGFSARAMVTPFIYESIDTVEHSSGLVDLGGATGITWRIKDILSYSISGGVDGIITPSLYSSKALYMPASLARYATIFYASSLVRYRPSIFDERTSPENAYLFDAIARECALPILVDALTGLEGRIQVFYDDDSMRT